MKRGRRPKVIKSIADFLESFVNPDEVPKGVARPMKAYQLLCYDISFNFMFKWIIKQSEMDEILNYYKDENFELKDGVLTMFMGEYKIELVAAKDDKETEFGYE